jgi:Flp pilus assembly protein TadD
MRYAIFGVVLGALGAIAQQTPPSQKSDQNKQQPSAKQSPADANPFPEATSRKAEDAANEDKSPEGSSSSHVDLKRLDAREGSESRISNGAGGFIHNPELAAKDDKVGKFYLENGDFKGAYDRYKEATEVAPEDANAVYGLAESARGLHRTEEAVNNYMIYLDAVPDGKKSKDARKALAALGHAPKK